jgi:hypothetical protein
MINPPLNLAVSSALLEDEIRAWSCRQKKDVTVGHNL